MLNCVASSCHGPQGHEAREYAKTISFDSGTNSAVRHIRAKSFHPNPGTLLSPAGLHPFFAAADTNRLNQSPILISLAIDEAAVTTQEHARTLPQQRTRLQRALLHYKAVGGFALIRPPLKPPSAYVIK